MIVALSASNPWNSNGSGRHLHSAMDHFPDNPTDPLGGEFRRKAWRDFSLAMEPFWSTAHAELAKRTPKDWRGYRWEVQVRWIRSSGQYHFTVQFRDGVSNRSTKLTSRNLRDLMICLHEAYRRFDALLEWQKVSLTQFWDEEAKGWRRATNWEYGRAILESGPENTGNFGMS